MRNLTIPMLMLVASLGVAAVLAADSDSGKPKYTIKEVMKRAHKDGLLKRLAIGQGTKAEARELLELYEALGRSEPPMGEPESWKQTTETLIAAARDRVEGKPDAGKRLQKAANCAECHKMHKPDPSK